MTGARVHTHAADKTLTSDKANIGKLPEEVFSFLVTFNTITHLGSFFFDQMRSVWLAHW